MSALVSCQKQYSINIPSDPCPLPTLKSWTTAAVTARTFDLTANADPIIATPVITSINQAWLIQAASPATWFIDTYNLAAANPIAPSHIFATDGAFPRANAIIYVPGADKILLSRQHWNGATYDVWLSFLRADGTESSHQVALTTETLHTEFVLIERNGLSNNEVVWLTGTKLYRINVDAETILASATYPVGTATTDSGVCYSCVTDSIFGRNGNDLVEYDRVTLLLKNTYTGIATGNQEMDYIKTTQELWLYPWGTTPQTVTIVDPKTGTIKVNLTLVDGFDGFQGAGAFTSHLYNDILNAFCIPGPTSGFSGNPITYYFYDVVSRALKKQIDITAYFNLFSSSKWYCQTFEPTTGNILLSGIPYNVGAGNSGTMEIAAS